MESLIGAKKATRKKYELIEFKANSSTCYCSFDTVFTNVDRIIVGQKEYKLSSIFKQCTPHGGLGSNKILQMRDFKSSKVRISTYIYYFNQ